MHTAQQVFLKMMKTMLRASLAVLLCATAVTSSTPSTPALPTAAPATRTPGVSRVCGEHTNLNDASGTVKFVDSAPQHARCWHIECDSEVVVTFPYLKLFSSATIALYSAANGKDFTFEGGFFSFSDWEGVETVLNGAGFVVFNGGFNPGTSEVEFSYVCDGNLSSPAVPTAVPVTTVPIAAPVTDVPATRTPGVSRVCGEHTNLDDAAGTVKFVDSAPQHARCWHIECDSEVVVTFPYLKLFSSATIAMYSAANGKDFTFEGGFFSFSDWEGVETVLNGAGFVVFNGGYNPGTSEVEFSYVCDGNVSSSPVPDVPTAPSTDVPATRTPGVSRVCDEHTNLNDSVGTVKFVDSAPQHARCWHIECDNDAVVVTFPYLKLFSSATIALYSAANGTDFTLERVIYSFSDWAGVEIVLPGAGFVVFNGGYNAGTSEVEFNYVCDGDLSSSPAPAVPTAAPATRTPGVSRVCGEHTNLDDAAGTVKFVDSAPQHARCWHIECDSEVVVTFPYLKLYSSATMALYSAANGTDFTLERVIYSFSDWAGVETVLNGAGFVVFNGGYYPGTSEVEFTYRCVADATPVPTPQPPQCTADTMPKRCGQRTSRACAFVVSHPALLLSVAFSADGRRVVTGAADGVVRVLDAGTGMQVGHLGCADGFKVHGIAFSPDNSLVALAGEGGRVVVCNAATGVLEATLMDMSASGSTPVHRVEFTRDGRYVVSGGGSDARTRVFDMLASDRMKASSVLNHHARNVAFSVDGAHLATVWGTEVGETTTVWRLNGTGTSAVELPSVGARVTALSFSSSAGGNALLRGMSDGTILVSQLPGSSIGDGSAVDGVSLSMLSGVVHDSKFSRDGQKIAAVGEGDVTVWSHDGSVLHELLGHSQAVLPRLDFSPDGTRLATVSRDGTLVVWKL